MFSHVHWSIPAALACWLILLTVYSIHVSKHRWTLHTRLCDTVETWKNLEKLNHELALNEDDEHDCHVYAARSHVYHECISHIKRIMNDYSYGDCETGTGIV